MNISKLLLPIALLLTANAANADQDIKYGIQASFGFGGDTFIEGGTTTTGEDTLTGGDNFRFGAYIVNPEVIYDLSSKLAINYMYGDEEYLGGKTEDSSTLSLDLLLMKEVFESFYLGAGVTYHLAPSYTYESSSINTTIDYDAELGFVIEATKTFRNGFEFGASYTSIEYSGGESIYTVAETVDASSFALTIGFSF